MDLAAMKGALTSTVGLNLLKVKKSSPTIMFAGGVVGVVATTVLACKATLRLEEVLEETDGLRASAEKLHQEGHVGYSEQDFKKDNLLITARAAGHVAKLYAPAVLVGVASITALTGSHVVLSKRNTALMAAYSALDKGFNEYRARVRDEFGDDKDRELRHGYEMREKVVADEDGNETTVEYKAVSGKTPSIYAKFFDDASPMWSRTPEYNHIFLNCQQNWANDLLKARGHVFLNEVYDMLKLPRTKAGAVVGWVLNKNGDNYVDFGIYDQDRERARSFVNGYEGSILLDFNVDGVIYDLLEN